MPALLTRTSTLPHNRTVSAAARRTDSELVTSRAMPKLSTPHSARSALLIASAPASFRSPTTTAEQSRASRAPIAAPIPCAPPVTNATRSRRGSGPLVAVSLSLFMVAPHRRVSGKGIRVDRAEQVERLDGVRGAYGRGAEDIAEQRGH